MDNIDSRYEARPKPTGLRYGIIEATTSCQFYCPGCYMVRRDALNKGEMSLEEAVRILNLCRDYCGRELETMDILGGEPLLWRNLRQYIEILLNRGIKPWIFTNMLAITPRFAKWLFDRKIHITGKLNINPDDRNQFLLQANMIGRDKKTARKMVAAIEVFLDAGYHAPLFRLQNLIRRSNIAFVPDYYYWCIKRKIGTDLELLASGEAISSDYWKIAPKPQEIAKMIILVQEVRREFGLDPAEVLMPHVFGSCPFYDKGLYFAVDGCIRACSNSTVQLSHVDNPNAIKEAYESPLICNRLRLSKEIVGEPCHACDRWEKCRGGCRATVEGMGDPFGGYILCPVPFLS